MSAYRFALRPRWIVSHLLVVVAVIVMVNLGFWQLHRLDEKRDRNALVRDRQEQPTEALSEIVPAEASFADAMAVTYRRAEFVGRYDPSNEVVVRSRSFDGEPGGWVLTPLVDHDGTAVLVNRGWFGTAGVPKAAPPEAAAPTGEITVTGLLMATQERGRFGPTDPPTGKLTNLARADLGRVQQQMPYDLYPVILQLERQAPKGTADLPRILPAPALDEGPHLGYAGQWFTFSTIAAVGYVLVLRRQARPKKRQAPSLAGGGAGGGDDGESPSPGDTESVPSRSAAGTDPEAVSGAS